ncbi:pilin [Francisella salimarina]|uniref:Type II secretion system GspH family protein n=1 Tax=Francisella salimarina TaxID=2599927 RepID=A0AAJ4TLN9_9GAMM|nr:type II secretion system protein [Francisella salimarina]QWV00081.1 type II secretion system GspH family protein [Francisella salimarina]
MRTKAGFSLLELMVMMVIMAIIATVAIPMYSDYKTRAKISATDAVANSYLNQVTDYTSGREIFPDETSGLWGCREVNSDNVTRICTERIDSQNAIMKVYVNQDILSNIEEPYYQYNLTLV